MKSTRNKLFSKISPFLFATWFGIDGGAMSDKYSGQDGIVTAITQGLNYMAGIAAVAAVAFIILGGIRYITSAGDAEKVKEAQGTLTNAVIGLVVIFLIRVIIEQVVKGLESLL